MRGRHGYRGGWHDLRKPLVLIAVLVAVVLIATVVAGNILNSCLDDETYKKLTEGDGTGKAEGTTAPTAQRTAPQLHAYPFTLGASLRTLGNDPPEALAIPINGDSDVLYHSPVVDYLALPVADGAAASAEKSMTALLERVPYLIGVWQPSLPSGATEAVLRAAAVRDAAVLREFLSMGGSELLLTGLSLSGDALEATLTYLFALQEALGGNVSLSASVPLAVATGEDGWDVLYALGKCVSFLTLDLRGEADIGTQESGTGEAGTTEGAQAESPLLRAQFYLSGYQMRLLLAESQKALIRSAEATVADFLIR